MRTASHLMFLVQRMSLKETCTGLYHLLLLKIINPPPLLHSLVCSHSFKTTQGEYGVWCEVVQPSLCRANEAALPALLLQAGQRSKRRNLFGDGANVPKNN